MFHDIFKKIGSLASPKQWIAILQRRNWMIAWKLWSDRNRCLHEIDHGNEIQDINRVLTAKYGAGLENLPSQYADLVCSNLDTLLLHDPSTKQKWLASIWSAREKHSGLQLHHDPEVKHNNFFLRWDSDRETH